MSRIVRFTLARIHDVDPDWWDQKGVPIEQAIGKRKKEPAVKESEAIYLSKEARGLINPTDRQIGTLPPKGSLILWAESLDSTGGCSGLAREIWNE